MRFAGPAAGLRGWTAAIGAGMLMGFAGTDFLLVVDVQNDFCTGGALAVPGGEDVVPVINRLVALFPHVGLTQDWHAPGHHSFASAHAGRAPFETIDLAYGPQTLWPDHCVKGSDGAGFHPGLDTVPAEVVIRKGFRRQIDSYSAFYENDRRTPTGLAGYLDVPAQRLSAGQKRRIALARLLISEVVYDGRDESLEISLRADTPGADVEVA